MLCAWKYFGPAFADVILDEELIRDNELRAAVFDLFETVRPASPPLELRRHFEDGSSYESIFIPTDPRHPDAR